MNLHVQFSLILMFKGQKSYISYWESPVTGEAPVLSKQRLSTNLKQTLGP